MANLLEYASVFQDELDKQIMVGSTSSWMEANAGIAIYNGGADIKIPDMSMDGLADYDRDDGYVKGAVSLKYETRTMTMDRARTFYLDAMDVNETNFAASAGNVMGMFQSEFVIPEVDAYRYSKLASIAIGAGQVTSGYTPTEADILSMLQNDIDAIQDEIGDSVPLVVSISRLVSGILNRSSELQRSLSVTDFAKGEVNVKVKAFNDIPLNPVPSARMKTEYSFPDGKSAGQEKGSFEPTAAAKNINWLITPRTVPIAVCKTDKIRIFDPETTQTANAWKLDYRKYHDIWVYPNKVKTIRVNTN